jgi:hypothetical protein
MKTKQMEWKIIKKNEELAKATTIKQQKWKKRWKKKNRKRKKEIRGPNRCPNSNNSSPQPPCIKS